MTATVEKSPSRNAVISDTIDRLRRLRGLTIKELAARAGIDEDTLGRRLRCEGKHGWLAVEVADCAMVLDADVDVIYNGLGDLTFRRLTKLPRLDSNQEPAGYRAHAA